MLPMSILIKVRFNLLKLFGLKKASKKFIKNLKGNLVAVISNGTAVLGLGNIGAAASKPVMEGKESGLKIINEF